MRLCKEIEDFLGIVIAYWDELFALLEAPMRERLYQLYSNETHPSPSNDGGSSSSSSSSSTSTSSTSTIPSSTSSTSSSSLSSSTSSSSSTSGSVARQGYTMAQITNLITSHKGACSGNTVNPITPNDRFVQFFSGSFSRLRPGVEYRVYVNASSKNVITLASQVTILCGQYKGIQCFKIPLDPAMTDARKDTFVIYVKGKDTAEKVAQRLGELTCGLLSPTVPAMTHPIANGISIAPNMGEQYGLSFGELVVSPFALAIRVFRDTFYRQGLLSHKRRKIRMRVFRVLLAGAFHAHGLDPQALFAAAGFPVMPAMRPHAIGVVALDEAKRKLFDDGYVADDESDADDDA
jgi:HopA1 effector protein family